MSRASAAAQKRWQVGQIPSPVRVDGDADPGAGLLPDGLEPFDVAIRIILPDLDLDAGETVLLDGLPDQGQHGREVVREPADIGVVGLEPVRPRTAEILPERELRLLRREVPQGDIDRRQSELGDAGSTDPLQGRVPGELGPQARAVIGILSEEERGVARADAIRDQPVGWEVCVGAGKPVADETVARDDPRSDYAPMGDAVS